MQPAEELIKPRELWPPGTVVEGVYTIEKRLGAGGFGTVYLARYGFFHSPRVIKRLHEQFAADEEYVSKFVNEGRAIYRLKDCPHIVQVEQMTQTRDGHLILIMEHVLGGDLATLMEARRLSIAEVIEFGRQIAIALQAAHEAGLIHRDIKPQNVLLSQDAGGETLLKLIDFGIAADQSSSNQQTSVMRGGSIGYAAPEQWVKSGKELDGRADLYALGGTLYRMLTGSMPFPEARDLGAWIERVKHGPPPSPSTLRPDTPPALAALILEMLAVRPEGRPASAASVAARLRQMQGPGRIPEPEPQTKPLPDPLPNPRPDPRSARRPIWWAAIALVLALLAYGGSMLVADRQAPNGNHDLPKPDYVTLGDKALAAGDFATALQHYRTGGAIGRLVELQQAVEADVEKRLIPLRDAGRHKEALALIDSWLHEFPGSARLHEMRLRTMRAMEAE